jgi:hypothetical protein
MERARWLWRNAALGRENSEGLVHDQRHLRVDERQLVRREADEERDERVDSGDNDDRHDEHDGRDSHVARAAEERLPSSARRAIGTAKKAPAAR